MDNDNEFKWSLSSIDEPKDEEEEVMQDDESDAKLSSSPETPKFNGLKHDDSFEEVAHCGPIAVKNPTMLRLNTHLHSLISDERNNVSYKENIDSQSFAGLEFPMKQEE